MSEDNEKKTDEAEASFNDAELQDIMSEIESLEQEFSESSQGATSEEAHAQGEHDENDEFDDSDFEDEDEVSHTAEVRQFKPSPTGAAHFEAHGQMEMKFSVPVGQGHAELSWSKHGLNLQLNGVEICLTEEGCQIELPGGAKFSVPSEMKSHKKAA